ncbi:hypothetical protein [Neoactinobaculum massilliense]|uniref:hypothetical protein n=1 Tax=Neoactinobaculum massilliense TaxID=2364794 RepID=UPI001F14E776|nr:hypothetical protein [Neoactinobaculum massilliense]
MSGTRDYRCRASERPDVIDRGDVLRRETNALVNDNATQLVGLRLPSYHVDVTRYEADGEAMGKRR